MIRIVIENIILLLLPTLIYVSYVYLRKRDNPKTTAASVLDEAPLLWLFAAGAVLVIGAMSLLISTDGGAPGQVYVPPSMQDGRFVPGYYK